MISNLKLNKYLKWIIKLKIEKCRVRKLNYIQNVNKYFKVKNANKYEV